jgi:hypothetical protein
MKMQTILWFYFPLLILGVVYTGLAAVYACAGEGGCWSGVGLTLPFSAIVAGLAYIQVLPGLLLISYVVLHISRRDKAWKVFFDFGWQMKIVMVFYFGAAFASIFITIALSIGGLVALRACALKECYPRLSAHATLAMFLSGQTTNLLIVAQFVINNEDHWSDDAVKYIHEFCNFRKRRQVCNLDQASIPT